MIFLNKNIECCEFQSIQSLYQSPSYTQSLNMIHDSLLTYDDFVSKNRVKLM